MSNIKWRGDRDNGPVKHMPVVVQMLHDFGCVGVLYEDVCTSASCESEPMAFGFHEKTQTIKICFEGKPILTMPCGQFGHFSHRLFDFCFSMWKNTDWAFLPEVVLKEEKERRDSGENEIYNKLLEALSTGHVQIVDLGKLSTNFLDDKEFAEEIARRILEQRSRDNDDD